MPVRNLIDTETGLTSRQRNLLFALIKEYCEFGLSVGSKELRDKYGFRFSPATIRNELARLRDLGYLYQPFTNASSQPTEKAFKIFINQLIIGLQVTSKQQQELKQQILEMEGKQANLQKELTRLLAFNTGGVGFSVNREKENVVGIKNLLANPSNGQVSDILDFLDNLDNYKQFLLEAPKDKSKTKSDAKKPFQKLTTLIGTENPVLPLGKGYAMVATEIYLDNEKTIVGLITPTHVLARKKNLQLIQSIGEILNPDQK